MQIADLEGELDKEWSSLNCPSSNGRKFWAHEWERHGSCALNLDEHGYFNSTLALKRRIDILGALEAAGKDCFYIIFYPDLTMEFSNQIY